MDAANKRTREYDSGPDSDSTAYANDTKRPRAAPDPRTGSDTDSDTDSDSGPGSDSDSTHPTLPSTPDAHAPKTTGKPLFCCQVCGIFMGPHNPRQLCAKYFCCNEP